MSPIHTHTNTCLYHIYSINTKSKRQPHKVDILWIKLFYFWKGQRIRCILWCYFLSTLHLIPILVFALIESGEMMFCSKKFHCLCFCSLSLQDLKKNDLHHHYAAFFTRFHFKHWLEKVVLYCWQLDISKWIWCHG